MRHLDLFSGIGGFAYAADQVWGDVEHIFCDNDKFCQQVLKKHWPESRIYGDIRDITTNPFSERPLEGKFKINSAERHETQPRPAKRNQDAAYPASEQERLAGFSWQDGVYLLTGGFPCQPFSAAGLRRGTADERHLWPEMLRVIQLVKPAWVIGENVRGLTTWNDGLVLEQVCADLEANGYEVQPLIIPAVAVNAPHRRDRIWFVAHTQQQGLQEREAQDEARLFGTERDNSTIANTASDRLQNGIRGIREFPRQERSQRESKRPYNGQLSPSFQRDEWNLHWTEVAAGLCSVDDGVSVGMGGLELSKSQHRKEQLKAYGNAIVPAVAVEIMKSIKEAA